MRDHALGFGAFLCDFLPYESITFQGVISSVPLAHESKETIPAGTFKKVRVLGKK